MDDPVPCGAQSAWTDARTTKGWATSTRGVEGMLLLDIQ